MITNEKLKLQFRGDDNMKLLKLPLGILMKGRVLLISLGKSHEFSGLMFSHLVIVIWAIKVLSLFQYLCLHSSSCFFSGSFFCVFSLSWNWLSCESDSDAKI